MHQFARNAASLSVLLSTLVLSTACSLQKADDLAVAKIPVDQVQATLYLPLNADKPGMPATVERYLVPGKYTIVAYFSQYDAPSMNVLPRLAQLPGVNNTVAVRTVDINRSGVQGIDWQSPVVQEAGIQTLPYFQIFDPGRNLRAHGRPAQEQIGQWVQSVPQ